GVHAGELQLRLSHLLRARRRRLHLRLHLPVQHPQARELLLMSSMSTTRGSRRQSRYISLQVVLGILMVYFLVPFWWVVVNSSKTSGGLFGGGNALWFADDIDYLGNLSQLFSYGGGIYARWLLNSALYAFVGGIGATALAVLAGYGFAKYQFRGRRLSFAVLLGAVMVPATALVIPTFILFSQAGLTNTVWA